MSESSEAKAAPADEAFDSVPQISIIVPTRNESENVRPLLDRLAAALSDFTIEVIFVDDSTDNTAEVLQSIRTDYTFRVLILVRLAQHRNGLSGAVVEGLKAASGTWICVMDADLQHPPETISAMWKQAQKTGADIVVGSRRGDLFGPAGLSRVRSLNSKFLTVIARTLFPRLLRNASDPLTGLFIVRRTAVDMDSLRPDGFKILLEILVRSPALQVSEVHFDFAPRHSGESKADVREGARFFRHLITLRLTVNPHLGRFLAVAAAGLLLDMVLMGLLFSAVQLPPYLATLFAAETTWLAIFMAFEYWVFSERDVIGRRRRFWGFFLLAQLAILLVHLPVFILLDSVFGTGAMLANFLAFAVVGLARYLLSEHWVWTRSAMVWQPRAYFYNLHDLVRIESQVKLRELDDFLSEFSSADADIQLRVDRQGTPSYLAGGISYDDQLGRFGFGLSVLPGVFTQVVVSPMLEHSPDFLYTNVVEPILRWRLVLKGYALVKAACVAKEDGAVLVISSQDLGKVVSRLCIDYDYMFLADDLVILDEKGNVYSYPKPLTVDRSMLTESSETLGLEERLALLGRRLLYAPIIRQIGLWFSRQDLPAATLNAYLQRFVPQPKHHLQHLFPDAIVLDRSAVVAVACSLGKIPPEEGDQLALRCLQQNEIVAAFQPHPLLAERLRAWNGEDLFLEERRIISSATRNVPVYTLESSTDGWWLQLVSLPTTSLDNRAHSPAKDTDDGSKKFQPDVGGEF